MIYLLKYFDKTVRTYYVFYCCWIYKEYIDLIHLTMDCILPLSADKMKGFELYFLMYVVIDLLAWLPCCLPKFVSVLWWHFSVTLNLLFKAMFNWRNTVLKTIRSNFFSVYCVCFNSFFNFVFSECLVCILISIIKVAILGLSLKLAFF